MNYWFLLLIFAIGLFIRWIGILFIKRYRKPKYLIGTDHGSDATIFVVMEQLKDGTLKIVDTGQYKMIDPIENQKEIEKVIDEWRYKYNVNTK